MSTTIYSPANRGKLVTVVSGDSARVYSKAVASAKTDEFVDGPATVGTATGYHTVDGLQSYTEVLRAVFLPGITSAMKVYLITEDVVLAENPAYDPATDLDRPSETDSPSTSPVTTPTTTTPTKTGTYDTGNVGTVDVEKTATTDANEEEEPTEDKTRKWLTYGLYAILGIAAVTLAIIIVQSIKKVKPAKA